MKNKGFTIVEVLAVLILLGLIGLIIFPRVKSVLNSSKEDLLEVQIKDIEDGAHNYLDDHPYDIPKNNGDKLTLSLCQLKLDNKVDYYLTNTKTNKMFNCATKIYVQKDNNKYTYRVDFDNLTEEVKTDKIYPNAKIVGNALEYMHINDEYDFGSVYVDNNILSSSNGNYTIKINTDLPSLRGKFIGVGTYIIEYIITDNQNMVTTLYKTIIVE